MLGALAGNPAAAAPAGTAAADDPGGEIIITARRREERLDRAAAPVSAVSGERLEERGAKLAGDLNTLFPALSVQPTASGNLIFVRGVGNFTLLPNSDPAVAFVLDGVFVSRPMGTMSQFFDVERIELLKGPQGVLYGRNASAGSINIEPRQPVIGERSARAAMSFATYDRSAEAAANLPLSNAAAIRLSAAAADDRPYFRGFDTRNRQQSGRAQVKALLGERVAVRFSADYNHQGGASVGSGYVGKYLLDPATGTYSFADSGLPPGEGLYSGSSQEFRQTIFLPAAGRFLDAIGSRPSQDNDLYGAHARIDADLGFGKLTAIPAWRRSKIDIVPSSAPFGYRIIEVDEQLSFEARLTGRRGALGWLVGTFLFDDSIDNRSITNLSISLADLSQRYSTKSAAWFGNGEIALSQGFRIGGGLRWTCDRKSYRSRGETLSILCAQRVANRPSCPLVPLFPLVEDFSELPFPIPGQPGPRTPLLVDGVPTGASVGLAESANEGRLTNRAATWRASAEADISSRTLAYATVETGNRPGGFSAGVGFETYDPERIRAYTLGLRHRGPGNRLRLDLEAFSWRYDDQQVSSLRPDLSTPPRNVNITDNIGSSRIRGVELDVGYVPWAGGQAEAIVQYLDSDYRSFEYVQARTAAPPLTGCPTQLDPGRGVYVIDCSGKQPYNSPKWSLTLRASQSVEIGGASVTGIIDSHYRSSRNVGFAFLDEQRVGPSWTTDAQIVVRPRRGNGEIAAFVRNIEGDRGPHFMIFHPVSNALIALTSPPRQWGIRARWTF